MNVNNKRRKHDIKNGNEMPTSMQCTMGQIGRRMVCQRLDRAMGPKRRKLKRKAKANKIIELLIIESALSVRNSATESHHVWLEQKKSFTAPLQCNNVNKLPSHQVIIYSEYVIPMSVRVQSLRTIRSRCAARYYFITFVPTDE